MSSRRTVLLMATLGAVLGGLAWWVFINTNPVDVEAAAVDGFPLWSMYGVPFVLPGVLLGALVGSIVGASWKKDVRR